MRFSVRLLALLMVLPAVGCLKGQLHAPVEDHRVQAKTIAELCRTEGYPESPCSKRLQDDLDAMAAQAKHLDQIVKGEKPEAGE
jgi:hypothetical protein